MGNKLKNLSIRVCITFKVIYKTNVGRMHYLCKRLLEEIALPLAQIPRISSRNVTIFSSLSRLLSSILSFILPPSRPLCSPSFPHQLQRLRNFDPTSKIHLIRKLLVGLLHTVERYNNKLQFFPFSSKNSVVIFTDHRAGIE